MGRTPAIFGPLEPGPVKWTRTEVWDELVGVDVEDGNILMSLPPSRLDEHLIMARRELGEDAPLETLVERWLADRASFDGDCNADPLIDLSRQDAARLIAEQYRLLTVE